METLNKLLPELSKKQQEYISYCISEYGELHDYHRGKFPFVAIHTAITCLKIRRELLRGSNNPTDVGKAAIGEKYLNQLINKLEFASPSFAVCEDETSVVMPLNSVRLARRWTARYSDTFYIMPLERTVQKTIQLKRLGINRWQVTTSKKFIDYATTFLSEYFG